MVSGGQGERGRGGAGARTRIDDPIIGKQLAYSWLSVPGMLQTLIDETIAVSGICSGIFGLLCLSGRYYWELKYKARQKLYYVIIDVHKRIVDNAVCPTTMYE